ncbi:PEX12 (predicted) [Pycnogonum litorale]
MAAAAVYISGSSVETPSIFEILAAGNLSSSIRSGFHHIWKVLIRRFPERFQLIKNNYDELYALFDLSLQYHYLKSAGGSFSENFYGLRRVCLSGAQVNESSLQLRRSLLLIVLAPYIARKLDAAYENVLDNAAQLDSCNYNESKSSKLRLFIKTYPYIRTICGLVAFVFQLYYLFGKSRFHSPLLYLAGVFLSVDAPNEEDKIQETASVLKKVTNSLVNGLSKSLYIGAFLIQFLEWYHSDDNENKIAVQWKKLPPPKIFVSL